MTHYLSRISQLFGSLLGIRGHEMWIWQQPDWPQFRWQEDKLLPRLRHLQQQRGVLLGRASVADNNQQQTLDTLLTNILSSSAIEDERVNAQSVRSSLARR